VASWRVDFDESGSDPVLAHGLLFVGSSDGAVYALDPATGQTKWRFQTGASLPDEGPGARTIVAPRGADLDEQIAAAVADQKSRPPGDRRIDMTPAVENGTLFIGSGDLSFYALDAVTGRRKWSYLAGPGLSNPNRMSRLRAPALVANGVTYFATVAGLHAVDSESGQRKWLFDSLPVPRIKERPRDVPGGPIAGEGSLFLAASDWQGHTILYALDPESGRATWTASLAGQSATRPVVARGLVLVAADEPMTEGPKPTLGEHCTLFAVRASDGKIAWQATAEQKFGSAQVLTSGRAAYFRTEHKLLALDLETGGELWSFAADDIAPGLAADARSVYVVTENESLLGERRTLHALALESGRESWARRVTGLVAAVAEGVVLLEGSHVSALVAATGEERWSYPTPHGETVRGIAGGRVFTTSPTVTYVGLSRVDQGYLRAVDLRTGR
jgi:outer membrane protein assembly factor BamB